VSASAEAILLFGLVCSRFTVYFLASSAAVFITFAIQLRPQQFLYFLPLPHGHGSFLPILTRFTCAPPEAALPPAFLPLEDIIPTIS
jgi:hypothetical protein